MSKANARRPIAALTVALLCVALTACGGGGGDDNNSSTQQTGTNTNQTTTNATATQFATGLKNPTGIGRDAEGNFYVADKGSFTIRKIPAAGGTSTVYAGTGTQGSADATTATAASFTDLRSLTVAENGAIYAVDDTSVRYIDPNQGRVATIITNLVNPQGIVVDGAFNVFVADAGAGTITKGTSEGTVSVIATGLTGVRSLALDRAGALYATLVAANGATTIKKIAGAATATTATAATDVTGGSGFTGATGIAVGSTGNIYVLEPKRITTLTSTGTKTTKAVAVANALSALTTAATGNDVYVTDSGANNVLKVTP